MGLSKKSFRWLTVGAGVGIAGAWLWRNQGDLTARRPLNEWTFSHMDRIMPTAPVRAGSGLDPLPRGTQVELADITYHFDGRRALSALTSRCYLTSLVVIHEGRVVVDAYPGRFAAPGKRLQLFSLSQTILSAALGIAGARADFPGFDVETRTILTELAGTAYGETTLQQLLDMRSGVGEADRWNVSDSVAHRYERAAFGGGSVLELVRALPRRVPAGTEFAESVLDTQVLTWVLERIAGEPLNEFIARELWEPMGGETDAYYFLSRGVPRGALGGWSFNATSRDLARFGLLLARSGRTRDGVEIVPEHWVTDCAASEPSHAAFRNLWWSDRPDLLTARGAHGQLLWIDRSADLVIAATAAWPQATDDRRAAEMRQACIDITRFFQKGAS